MSKTPFLLLALLVVSLPAISLPAIASSAPPDLSVAVTFDRLDQEDAYLFQAEITGTDGELLAAPRIRFAAGTPAIAETSLGGTLTLEIRAHRPLEENRFEYSVELLEGGEVVRSQSATIHLD